MARVTAGSSAAPARRDQGLQQNSKQERGNSPEGIPSGFWGIPSGFWAIPSGKGWELWHSCPGQGWVPIPAGMSVPVLVALGDTGQCDLGRAGGLQGPCGVFQPEPLWGSGTQLEFFIDTKGRVSSSPKCCCFPGWHLSVHCSFIPTESSFITVARLEPGFV